MNGVEKRPFSVAAILAGPLGAFLGPALKYSFLEEFEEKFEEDGNYSFEKQKVLNLLAIMEEAYAAGKLENVKKYARMLVALLQKLFNRKIPPGYRQKFFSAILYRLFIRLGDYLLDQGRPAEALVFYQDLLSSSSGDTYLLKKAARAYYARGMFFLPRAEEIYQQILEQNNTDLEIYMALGRLLEKSPGREKEAVLIYREALRRCPDDFDKIAFYLKLLALSPDDENLLLRLGRLYRRQGMFIEARYYLEEALKRREDPWTALELALLCCALNDLRRAGELLQTLCAGDELFPSAHYLCGLFDELEEKWDEARQNYLRVPPEAPLYWAARMAAACTLIHEGKYREAEEMVRDIPGEEKRSREEEYLELCILMENSAAQSSPNSPWREYLRERDPDYELKKDIRKRNMGSAFWRKYEFLEVLKRGPAGSILLGRERGSGRRVAIKVIQEDFSTDPVFIRRLQGYLKTLRGLCSPYLVQIYEDAYYNRQFFFAMEYMEGEDLADFSRLRAPLPLMEACHIVLQVCAALDYLYSCGGISHGNLKPENILISADRKVKISGFDLLWLLEGSKLFSEVILEKYPSFAGTFRYAAPERFDLKGFFGKKRNISSADGLEAAVQGGVDHRADLYSLGVIFFELLTGFLPFEGNDLEAVLRFHRSFKGCPSPRLFHPALPEDLEEIILTLLNRNPAERFATPAELKEALKKARIF